MSDLKEKVQLFEQPEYGGGKAFLTEDNPDLTVAPVNLPKGASSVKIGSNQRSWRVFTEVNYQGASTILSAGKDYSSPENIGLVGPIKSMRVS
ncbi:unnamed protein product [Pocillopora meandrina]|uniref:Beta/gamma crystallin 'Greek key' domain-containing protein n=1 Tax=Pocillopora meandrina TaxID=46732 RepID=A0AAU9XYS9_9CNID|nr:unnamed protein product [Pocillopora meandrina]